MLNDQQKKYIIFITAFIVFFYFITCCVNFRQVENRNRSLEKARAELSATIERLQGTTAELDEYRRGIKECSESIGRINSRFESNNDGFRESIERLELIEQEVENMERTINHLLYDNISDSSIANMEVE